MSVRVLCSFMLKDAKLTSRKVNEYKYFDIYFVVMVNLSTFADKYNHLIIIIH